MVWANALGRVAAGVLSIAIVVAALDYSVRFQDRGLRIMASLAVLITALALAWRLIWPAARVRLSDLDLALLVERRFPKLRDQLATTVEFLHADPADLEAGSLALRREVIHQAATDSAHFDLGQTLDPRPALRAGLAGTVAIAMVAIVALSAPADFRIASMRLIAPWSDTAWPNVNHLVLVKPVQRLAAGERFEVAVADAQGAKLPSEVRIHYRFDYDSARPQERAEPMRLTGGVMVAGIESVSRPFLYRAEGGDDDTMPWTELIVVEPPALEQLEVTLHYPEYTGWNPAVAEANFRALVGTRVAIAGRANKPLRSALVRFEPGNELPLTVTADGYSFALAHDAMPGFVVSKTASFTIDLEDGDGFHGGRDMRYEVRAVEDHAPTVALEEPPADTFLTAEAIVPVRTLAKDDLAVRNVELRWSRSDHSDQPDTVVSLYDGPERVEPSDAADTTAPGHGEARSIDHRWDLKSLGLKPGTRLSLYAAATDYRGATTQSHPRQLSIITGDELQDRLTERQGAILNELNRMLKLERDSRAQVSGVQIQLDQVGKLNKNDTDHLQQAELTQRQIERGIGRREEGIP
ncbi:MAG TPA: hypothetical protein VG713_03070, partial [Pirellulales bacterium]|nr:hypothetical protein [Pirellulales bacterium]